VNAAASPAAEGELSPSAARRARRRVPLAERAAVQGLHLGSPSPDDGRALRAFFTVTAPLQVVPAAETSAPVQVPQSAEPPPPAEPGEEVEVPVEVPPAVLAATLSAPRRVETEWLTAPLIDGELHHADLGLHAVHDLALDEQHRVGPASAILLGCGRVTRLVSFPAAWQRTDAQRCASCCAALGYPPGTGAPVNDDECRAVLAERFGATP